MDQTEIKLVSWFGGRHVGFCCNVIYHRDDSRLEFDKVLAAPDGFVSLPLTFVPVQKIDNVRRVRRDFNRFFNYWCVDFVDEDDLEIELEEMKRLSYLKIHFSKNVAITNGKCIFFSTRRPASSRLDGDTIDLTISKEITLNLNTTNFSEYHIIDVRPKSTLPTLVQSKSCFFLPWSVDSSLRHSSWFEMDELDEPVNRSVVVFEPLSNTISRPIPFQLSFPYLKTNEILSFGKEKEWMKSSLTITHVVHNVSDSISRVVDEVYHQPSRLLMSSRLLD